MRVLTQNVRMLPGLFGDGDADLVRAGRLVEAINDDAHGYDVLCLQEVFDEHARGVFARGFAPFALVPKVDDGDIFHEDSGLFFGSRVAIEGWSFSEFDESAGDDSWSDKGIFGARLGTASSFGGVNLCVFHTHMQASYDGPAHHADIRTSQLQQIRRFVSETLSHNPPERTAAILVGDLNVVGDSAEYGTMLDCLGGPRDLYREAHPNTPGHTTATDGRLDYVLAFDRIELPNGDEVQLRRLALDAVDVVDLGPEGTSLSDHFGVATTLSLAP